MCDVIKVNFLSKTVESRYTTDIQEVLRLQKEKIRAEARRKAPKFASDVVKEASNQGLKVEEALLLFPNKENALIYTFLSDVEGLDDDKLKEVLQSALKILNKDS